MKKTLLMLGFLFFTALNIFAQKSEIFNPKDGAIHGYDPVAYFKESKPVKGNPKFSVSWMGANWYFSSQEIKMHLKRRLKNMHPSMAAIALMGLQMDIKRLPVLMRGQ